MDSPRTSFSPNFSATHAVTLKKPISEVFQKLGTASAHADVCRLSVLCTGIELGDKDFVALASADGLQASNFLNQPRASPTDTPSVARRQHFVLEETVPALFGFLKVKVQIRGTLTWNDPTPATMALGGPFFSVYESEVINGLRIKIVRLRKIEEVEVGDGQKATEVTEYLKGECPSYLKRMVANEAILKHKAHVARYPELFE